MPMISPLTDRDFSRIEVLARRIWPVAYEGILKAAEIENLLSRIYHRDNLAAETAQGHRFWGAFENGQMIGFASGYREGEDVWIKKLYVLPEAQGKGAGRQLMETVIAAFAPARTARLLVNAGNTAAQRVYQRCGFVKAQEVSVKMGDFFFTDYLYIKPL